MADLDYERLSRTVAHALRHDPGAYGLEVDGEGWASLSRLLEALRRKRPSWRDLRREDLEEMIRRSEKRRYEIRGDHIRALYGHSLPVRIEKEEAEPPERLFHGTSPEAARGIRRQGLRPMDRQYVHLSADRTSARRVGRRKASDPVILAVRARAAYRDGISFYRGNDEVWLADVVPPRFLERA